MITTTATKPEGISDFEWFCRNALAVYACEWIDSCQTAIARHASEIFEDATLRSIVEKYAEEKREAKKSGEYEFVRVCIGEDINVVDNEHEIHHDAVSAYKTVLNDLIFDRYCRSW